jgi:hypothetical protein
MEDCAGHHEYGLASAAVDGAQPEIGLVCSRSKRPRTMTITMTITSHEHEHEHEYENDYDDDYDP